MGRMATLSPLGLFEWDNTVFDFFQLPAGVDRETLLNNLLAETAELEVLYPNPVVFKNLVGVWSRKELGVWTKLYETTLLEYNPLENYNRTETGTTDGTGSTRHTGTDTTTGNTIFGGKDNRTESIRDGGSDRESGTSNLVNGGTDTGESTEKKEHYKAAFDSQAAGEDDGLVKETRDENTIENSTTYGKTENITNNKSTTYGKTENVSEELKYGQTINKTDSLTHGEQVETSNEGSHTLHAYGNIGVTTSQQMLQQEREVDLFNLYDIIIESFKMRFCILVY